MKFYCLNLPRAVDRRAQMQRLWTEERGFELEFFPAVDRRDIAAGAFPLPYDPAAARSRCGRELTPGEVACATSHHLLLRHALAAGHTEIVVMEDDILPAAHTTPPAVNAAIQSALTTFPRLGVLILHEALQPVRAWETRGDTALLAEPPFGFCCVWLNARAMELLARDLATLCYPADWLWTRRFAPMKTVAMTTTPFCTHDGKDSYIGNSSAGPQARRFIP